MSSHARSIRSVEEARALLVEVGAPTRLVVHGLLVAEAAKALLVEVTARGVAVEEGLVLAGAVLHDAGKSIHPAELDAAGAQHELAGERLLLERGVDSVLARCCVSHAAWQTMECSLEELLVALADKLWKGVRQAALEAMLIERVAVAAKGDRWALLIDLDTTFENIASDGPERLARSRA